MVGPTPLLRQSVQDLTLPANPDFAASEIAVYIHWPFCQAKCPYCDFNSHVRRTEINEQDYLHAYRQQIAEMAERSGTRTARSIFFGGGTPSLMSAELVSSLIQDVAAAWPLCDDAEITLEANPTSVEASRFAAYRQAGVTRVSLGIQALNDDALSRLGRLHDVKQGLRAYALARQYFSQVSCDLIYARPGQTVTDWRYELTQMLALAPDHLSAYQLTLEPGTPFFALAERGKLVVPDDDTARALYDLTQELCDGAGLPAYEISNHAKFGCEARHNLAYWRGADYIGLGPGAHGRITQHDQRWALVNEPHPERWIRSVSGPNRGLIDATALTADSVAEEYVMMALRLDEGASHSYYQRLTGQDIDPMAIADLEEMGLIARSTDRLRATKAGRPVLNHIIARLLA